MSKSNDLKDKNLSFKKGETTQLDYPEESYLPPNCFNFHANDPAKPNQTGNGVKNTDEKGKLFRSTLHELAEELSYNYFTNSFGDNYNMEIANCKEIFKNPDKKSDGKRSFRERFENRERVRNIMVIGAGAPFDAYTAIPRGEGLIEEIKRFYENEIKPIPFLRRKFEQEELEIKDITGKDTLNFENYLYLLSKLFITQTDIREKIKDMVGFRYSVSLFYEIVAHMLKHAFIDVVVNFNFEETLDQIIEEEIGLDNYHNIIYDGNCVGLDQILVDGRLKMPVYVKPHGTFSHKSTLRFTNRHYFDLPNDIKTMLGDLLSGNSGDKKPTQTVNLIIVGFAVESIEFNHIIDENLPRRSVIYHIDFNPAKDGRAFFKGKEKTFGKFVSRALEVNAKKNDIYKPLCTAEFNKNTNPDNNNSLTAPLGELFSVLWRVQNDVFRKPYKPRSIARHEITSYLLYDPNLGAKSEERTLETLIEERKFIRNTIEECPKYFRNRVLVELFILLNRSNGIIDIAEILKGRTGMFYNKYLDAFTKKPKSIKKPVHSIYELIQVFAAPSLVTPKGLLETKEYNTGSNIFILQSEFSKKDLENLKAFEDKLSEIRISIEASFQKVSVPKNHPLTSKKFAILKHNFLDNWISLLLDAYKFINKHNYHKGDHELVKLGRAITLFYRLISSKFLSERFKLNLMYNHDKRVFNGRKFVKGENVFDNDKQIMLNDLFRLLAKSWSHHYFVIDPAPSNPVHHLWESFSKRKVIHTNLARTAEFNYLLLNRKWDVLLSTTETGSLLNFLHHVDQGVNTEQRLLMKKKLKDKQFIFICSYESIRQLYPDTYDKEQIINEHRKHLRVFIKRDGTKETYVIEEKNITVLAVPFNQHNQHFSIFLQGLTDDRGSYQNFKGKSTIITNNDIMPADNEKKIKYLFDAIGSIYIYRSGFSNSIDPIYVGLADNEATNDKIYRDQVKLIKSFITHLNRAFKFERFSRKKLELIWNKPELIKELQEEWEDNGYRDIKKDDFLKRLYNRIYKNA